MNPDEELLNDLTEYMAHDEAVMMAREGEEVEGLLDEDRVNRILFVLGRLERERERIVALARQEFERIQGWQSDRVAGVNGQIGHLERVVKGWARAQKALDPKKKTIPLPNGAVKVRPPRASIAIVDPAAALEWAAERDRALLVKVEESVKAGELAKLVTEGPAVGVDVAGKVRYRAVDDSGEAVPGVEILKAAEDTVTIDVR